MTTQIAAPPIEATQARARRRFTVAEYYAMADAGILTEKDRGRIVGREDSINGAHRQPASIQR